MKSEPHILDAKGKSLGRIASEAALYLRGKRSPAYERHIAPVQKVVIKNADLVRVTGRKMLQEGRERYSGWPGGLKKVLYKDAFKKDTKAFVRSAVGGMIPRNRLKKNILKNLTIHVSNEN